MEPSLQSNFWKALPVRISRRLVSAVLNIQYKLQFEFEKIKLNTKNGTLSDLDHEKKQEAERQSNLIQMQYLEERLVRFPYWFRGHFEYCNLAIKLNQPKVAYAASLAACQLSQSPLKRYQCYLLNAQSLRLAGDYQRAKDLLVSKLENLTEPLKVPYFEEIVNNLVALKDFLEAKEYIARIPEGQRSGELNLVADFLSQNSKLA